jgi:imidazolonepropionase
MRLGTGAVEIKSGYGLTLEGLKMLHVIKRLSQNYPVAIKATFLVHMHSFRIQRQSSDILTC